MNVVIQGDPTEQGIIHRLATAVIVQWSGFDQKTKDGLLREACLAVDQASATTSLQEQILAFIRKHQEGRSAPRP
jgi:hypothetical protein